LVVAGRTITAVEAYHIASVKAIRTVTRADHTTTEVVIVGSHRIVVAVEADHTTVTEVNRTAEVEAVPTVVEAKRQLKVVRSQAAWWEELELEAAVGLGVLQRGL